METTKGKRIMIGGIAIMLAGIALMAYRIAVMLKQGVNAEAGYPVVGLFTFLTGCGVSLYGYSVVKGSL